MTQTKPTAVPKQALTGTMVKKAQAVFVSELESSLENNGLQMDEEQRACAMSAILTMSDLCTENKVDINDFDKSKILAILQQITTLRLNFNAIPRECYMILRNIYDPQSRTVTGHYFDWGVEGDGNDKLVRRYGVGIKKMYSPWIVREHDKFTNAVFKGLEIEPPTWEPADYNSKAVKVVYPVEFEDGDVRYYIADRDSVAINLTAHIINNTKMKKDKDLPAAEKRRIKDALDGKTLDEILADQNLMKWASPAWNDPHSREQMIIRKMRNNAVKPIPKDFGNAFTAYAYEQTYEDYEQYRQPKESPEEALEAEIDEKAGTEEMPENVIPEHSSVTAVNLKAQPEPEPVAVDRRAEMEGTMIDGVNVPFL